MVEPRDSHQAYHQARQSGMGNLNGPFSMDVARGIEDFKKDQERKRETVEFLSKQFSPEYQRVYDRQTQAIWRILRPFLVWSAFGMGVYFGMHALAKVFGMGETKAVFPFYTSINGFFAIGVAIPMIFVLYKLYKKSSKRFWQVNLSLVAVSLAVLLI